MAYTSAEALCDRLGERADLFPAIWGQWMFRTGRSETEAARRLGTRLLAMAEKFGDSGLKIQAHHAMWSTSFVCGALAESCAHANAALALFDTRIHQSLASSYGNHDAGCCARNFSALALALAGDEPGARAMIEQTLAAARSLDDPFSLALTLAEATGERFYSAELHRLQGELSARAPHADRRKAEASFRAAVAIARQQGAAALEHKAAASLRRWCG